MKTKESKTSKSSKQSSYEVHGKVTGISGKGVAEAQITVWRQLMRQRLPLAKGRTSKTGAYRLKFHPPNDTSAQLLIIVEARSHRLSGPLISPLTTAQSSLQIDLSAEPSDQSEFTTLMRTIHPLLDRIPLLDVVEDAQHHDISFLAQETRQSTEQIMRVVLASRMEATYSIPAAAFYSFLRQNVPSGLPSPLLDASDNFTLIDSLVQNVGSLIFALPATLQQSTLTAAVALDLIGHVYTARIVQIVSQLQSLRATDLINQPYQVGSATLGQILNAVSLPAATQQAFARALAINEQSMRNFWRMLGDGQHGFTAAEASAIERTLSVGSFVKNYVPLVTTLVNGFTSGTYQTLPDLARLSLKQWVAMVNQTGAPPGIDAAGMSSPAEVFATVIYTRVTRAYPTAALSSRIASANLFSTSQQAPLAQFFQNNPTLELVKDSLPAYLASQKAQAFSGINEKDQPAVIANTRSIQRVLRIAPSADVAQTLLSLGLISATQIASLGQQQFFLMATAAGLTKPEANLAFQAAAQRYANVVSLYTQFNRDSLGIWPQAMGQLPTLGQPVRQAVQSDPTLATLFGSQDYCAIDDCTSILSPAAYLCDLLFWLRNHPQSGGTALDVLDSRRPDIRHLLLNCPNSDTELPYIDLVIELLADKISPPLDSLATSYVQSGLENNTPYYFIVTAINTAGESAASAQVSATPNTPAVVPAAPTGVSATPGDSQITLSWPAVPGATSYNIYWSTATGVTMATGTQIIGIQNPYLQMGLTNGTAYYYIVTAVNSKGESAPSAQASTTPVAATAVPPVPTGVSASPGDGQITLSWNAVPGATSCNVYWSTSAGVTEATGTKIVGASNPYILAELLNGTSLYFIVTALNSLGESSASPQITATPNMPTTAPGTPMGVSATPGNGKIIIAWNTVPGANGYNVYWSTSSGVTTANGTEIEIVDPQNPLWKQTSEDKTPAQLSAAPEYFNRGAFIILFNASYPQSLPYSTGLDELRTYLLQWNLPLWQLRQALLPFNGGSTDQQAAVAAERLGMNVHAADLVTNIDFVPRSVAWNTGSQDPETALLSVAVASPDALSFLAAASITYEQLLELLEVAWVQQGLGIQIVGLNDSCDTTGMTLSPAPLDPGFLDRTHRFLRLWIATGYKMWELDLLLTAPKVGNNILDQEALINLQSFWQLQNATKLAVDQQLAFFQNLDTNTHRDPDGTTTTSRYAQIFLNPTTTWVAPDPDLASLPGGGVIGDPVLSDHVKAIQPALGVSASDFATLVALTDNQLTLENLSLIYRVNALAVATKFSIPSLLNLAGLLGGVAASPATALASAITSNTQSTITVGSASSFPPPNFYIKIGTEILLVTGMGGAGNTTWTVMRGQLGTSPAAALPSGAPVTSDFGSPAPALASLFQSPANTLAFLPQATEVRQQSSLSLDAITYLLTPPSAITGGWATTSQMTQANITATLEAIQQTVFDLLSASTTLAASITTGQTYVMVAGAVDFPSPPFYINIGTEILQVTAVSGVGTTTLASAMTGTPPTITVASNAGFPPPPFYVGIGSEVLQVTAVSGSNNTTWAVQHSQLGTLAVASAASGTAVTPVWAVQRGQLGTAAAIAASGAAVTPTRGDLDGSVIATTAASAHTTSTTALTNAVAASILQTLLVPGTSKTLLTVLEDPALVAQVPPWSTMTIGGIPATGDTLQTVLTDNLGHTSIVSYPLAAADSGNLNQTALHFAQQINNSPAVVGPNAFLAPCTVSGAVITLTALTPRSPGSNITSTNTALPGGSGHVSITPGTTAMSTLPVITQASFPNQFLAIQLFDKIGVLVRGLNLVLTDFSWLLANPSVYGGLDFTQLPVTTGQPALSLSPLLTTLLVIKLARLWTAASPSSAVQTLYDIIGGVKGGTLANAAAAQTALATISGWPLADIESFAAALSLNFPADYQAPDAYDALRTLEAMSAAVNASGPVVSAAGTTLTAPIASTDLAITVASAIGFPAPSFYINIGAEILLVTDVSGADNTTWAVQRGQQGTTKAAAAVGATVTPTYGAQIVTWGSVPADEVSAENMAASALGVLKAQQSGEDAWLALAPTLMNPIRENQSAALQSYLTSQRDGSGNLIYSDTNGLFNYFLIDTQMTSCQVTSRIVQAYIAVQIFVERCLMNLEAPKVVVDLTKDDSWNQWEWMKRYRIWEANREVFLYPENWLIESQRPNRTEIYQKFEQEVRQGQSTTDYLETVVLNYIDRLDGLAHLLVTGTCQDPDGNIYVVARTLADPPIFYMRSYVQSAWGGWAQIPLDIKAHQVVPAIYRGRVCLFWPEVKVSNEPKQNLPAAQASTNPPSQDVERYVTIGIYFSIFRNGSWAPAQTSKGKLFDKPIFSSDQVSDPKTVEALYTLKAQNAVSAPNYGANLWVDVFRFGDYNATDIAIAEGAEAEAATLTAQAAQASGDAATVFDIMANAFTTTANIIEAAATSPKAVHVGRAVFDGRFNDLELNNLSIAIYGQVEQLLPYAQETYGPEARPLLPLTAPDPDLVGEPNLLPMAGALETGPLDANAGSNPTMKLTFTAADALEQNAGTLLNTAQIPFRVVGPDNDLNFDPTSYFFFQDNRRCYYVESEKSYWTGSTWSPVVPSDPSTVAYEVQYNFHTFYHPFTRLFWNQLAGGGFDLFYNLNLQQAPDNVDPSYSEVFSFQTNYNPAWLVQWDHADASTTLKAPMAALAAQTTITVANNIWVPSPPAPAFYVNIGSETLLVTGVGGTNNTTWTVQRAQNGSTLTAAPIGTTVTPTWSSQDRQFLDFSPSAAFSVYNWELFYHIPLYVAQLLSQNQQFEDAQAWFHYIFNPTRQGSEPVPQRFWIPKPLHNLTSGQILQQQISNLLEAVNQKDPTAVAQVQRWRDNPFNPFLLADMRMGVPYMKSTVMSYLDNLIAWGDNLFATESREALSEATLLYVLASELLGPTPTAVTPPMHADASFDQLEPTLDSFANSLAEIENSIGGAGATGSSASNSGASAGGIPAGQSFYFKIPPNATLLNYWTTVADRLFKLRNCQNIAGAPLELALFDTPIDPGLLIAAQAAGVDLSSVLSDISATLPNYRFTSLYPQALDFVNAVRAYGASLQAALEKSDSGALSLLQQTTQQQLLNDGSDILEWQVQQAQSTIDNLNQSLVLAQQKYDFNHNQNLFNDYEITGTSLAAAASVTKAIAGTTWMTAAVLASVKITSGAAGIGGSPTATITIDPGKAAGYSAKGIATGIADIVSAAATVCNTIGSWQHRKDAWDEAAKEANTQITQAIIQIAGAQLGLQVAQQSQVRNNNQIDNIQKQIDFLNDKFTNDSLYDWMAGSLAATYFQSYKLAYQMCKQVERCYRFELGIQDSSFIQFGYWDSLHKGLLSGETLNHDLRRMQASYLQQNARRFEMSRYVSLGQLNPAALQQLLVTGKCDFTLPESLYDNDYPGHFNRRLTRMSVTVIYPNPGKFDNVKATLTLVANQVRTVATAKPDGSDYAESPVSSDARFIYNYAANAQKIALGNAQDDPGLFLTSISNNLSDQRYLPFENAGAISSWHLEMRQINNEIDISTVGDVVVHLYYTALDGGAGLQTAARNYYLNNPPAPPFFKIFSAQNDFVAPPASGANAKPVSPWQAFLYPPTAGGNQILTLPISPSKFPAWTHGKTINVTSLTLIAITWPTAPPLVLVPQAPLPTAALTMTAVTGSTSPNIVSATVSVSGTLPATWGFEIQQQGAGNFTSLTPDTIGDVLLLVGYTV